MGIIPLAAGVETTLRKSANNSVQELIDYTRYSSEDDRHIYTSPFSDEVCMGSTVD